MTVRTIHAAARREHQPPDAIEAARLRQNLGGGVVEVDRLFSVEVARRIAHDRRQGDDAVDVTHSATDVAAVADVSLHDLEPRVMQPLDAGAPVVEPVEDANMIAALEQQPHEMRTDVAGAAGHEDSSEAVLTAARPTFSRKNNSRSDAVERLVQQLVERRGTGTMHFLPGHEALSAAHRLHTDPGMFELAG